ncbi:hydrogenase iron-sulfur subunit [Candidatus Aerophobetes bacterium]|nr:hydrogenase iron-sulfur subunit [Candidatus Aerophobetes bacterium]
MEFEPEIVIFCCQYCTEAADTAGASHLGYPANIKLMELPCSGKISIIYLLKAFEEGADGVCVIGCEEGACHFLRGNLRAKKVVEYTQKILEEIGINKERLKMFNLSSLESQKFVQISKEITEKIRELGPIF